MPKTQRVPSGKDAKIVNSPSPENLSTTKLANQEEVKYDTSQPVFMMSKRISGKVDIPLYEDVPKVKGYFKNLEHPGQSVTLPHRSWKGPIRHFALEEGRLLEIPVTLAKVLNEDSAYVEKKWITDDGKEITSRIMTMSGALAPNIRKEIVKKIPRFSFTVWTEKMDWKPEIIKD